MFRKIGRFLEYALPIVCYIIGIIVAFGGDTTVEALCWMIVGNTFPISCKGCE